VREQRGYVVLYAWHPGFAYMPSVMTPESRLASSANLRKPLGR
jgi:hypothetical protein